MNNDQKNEETIDQKYDNILVTQLTKRLGRVPTHSEVTNGDNDSDLVNECLWELIVQLSADIDAIKKKLDMV